MKALMIKDLSLTEELDRKAMAAVQGGMGSAYQPSKQSYGDSSSWGPQYDVSKNSFNFDISQSLDQSQNTLVNNGTNVAFSSGITSTVTPKQTGTNTINFG